MSDTHAACMNFVNALEKLPEIIAQHEKRGLQLKEDIPVLQGIINKSWGKEDELKKLKSELRNIDLKIKQDLQKSPDEVIAEAKAKSAIQLEQKPEKYSSEEKQAAITITPNTADMAKKEDKDTSVEKMKVEYQTTPLYKQFEEMKKKHPDAILLFRVGDFYETFSKDAVAASEILGITLTRRANGKAAHIELAGFPHHALDTYLPKLVRAGKRVAICEQLEDPKRKVIIDRDTDTKEKVNKTSTGSDSKIKDETTVSAETNKTRVPQMVTVNGQKVTHGHAYQGSSNSNVWYFTAKLDGVQLKPQRMSEADVIAYAKREISVTSLMERYFPTKLLPKVPEGSFKMPADLPSSKDRLEKFNVYKEKDPSREDFGKYKFYAQVGEKKMSVLASSSDLSKYFDRVATPAQLTEKLFGERLHMPSAYKKYVLPDAVKEDQVRIFKSREGKWSVIVNMGERGNTPARALSYDDGFSYFSAKTASKGQLAAKYLGTEMNQMLSSPLVSKRESTLKV